MITQGLIDQSLLGLSNDGVAAFDWELLDGPEAFPFT